MLKVLQSYVSEKNTFSKTDAEIRMMHLGGTSSGDNMIEAEVSGIPRPTGEDDQYNKFKEHILPVDAESAVFYLCHIAEFVEVNSSNKVYGTDMTSYYNVTDSMKEAFENFSPTKSDINDLLYEGQLTISITDGVKTYNRTTSNPVYTDVIESNNGSLTDNDYHRHQMLMQINLLLVKLGLAQILVH